MPRYSYTLDNRLLTHQFVIPLSSLSTSVLDMQSFRVLFTTHTIIVVFAKSNLGNIMLRNLLNCSSG